MKEEDGGYGGGVKEEDGGCGGGVKEEDDEVTNKLFPQKHVGTMQDCIGSEDFHIWK